MDPISNMMNSIKNAGSVKKESVVFTHSKLKESILGALAKANFIASVTKKGKKVVKYLDVTLAYEIDAMGNKVPKVSGVQRVSKTSKRIYVKAKDIRLVRNGYGAMILSTPNGIMTGSDARKAGVGGEVLFKVW